MQLAVIYNRGSQLLLTSVFFSLLASSAYALDLADKPLVMTGGSTNIKPNVMLMMDNSGSMNTKMTEGDTTQTRLQASKDAAKGIVSKYHNKMRLGIFKFNPEGRDAYGGSVATACASPASTSAADITANKTRLDDAIDALRSSTHTPLAETYHDVTRYFRGLAPFADQSPIQYPCQENHVIVVTDGEPYDDMIPANIDATHSEAGTVPHDPSVATPSFPQWDADNSNDGNLTNGKPYLLDDLAKFGYDIDLINTDSFAGKTGFENGKYPWQHLVTHTIAFNLSDVTATNMLRDAANDTHGHGKFGTATSQAELTAMLDAALGSINTAALTSVAGVAVNSGSVSNSTFAYRAAYSSTDWSGSVTPYNLSATPPTAGTAFTIPASRATIYSYDGTAQVNFKTDTTVAAAIKASLQCPADTCASGEVAAVIDYLAGGKGNEQSENGTFSYRNRSSKLGDIINSAPAFVAKPNYRYPDTLSSSGADDTYSKFKTANASRSELVVVGANDGMLHAFNTSSGNEVMAYMPRMVLNKVKKLTELTYSHEYFVDGSPTVGDAYYDGAWHTVLASGMNKGSQGVFGLELTNTSSFTALKPWEFTDANHADMGYSYSQPAIVLMQNGKWAAVFGNGFNSGEDDTASGGKQGSGNAVLYIAYLGKGEDGFTYDANNPNASTNEFVVLDTSAGGDNGLATVAPVDINGDFIIDVIYAGDLKGNVWKFNVSSTDSASWSSSKLYTRCAVDDLTCLDLAAQPITVRPEVGRGPKTNSLMVYFGTGQYLTDSDPGNTDLQSFYAVLDESLSSTATVNAAQLQVQTITNQADSFTITDPDDSTKTKTLKLTEPMRVTSNTPVLYSGDAAKKGWYIDLKYLTTLKGERVISNPILRNGRIIVTTNYFTAVEKKAVSVSCSANKISASGAGWIMEFDALSGSRLAYSPFDINGDKVIDIYDTIRDGDAEITVSGTHFGENIAAPTIIANGGTELIVTAGSDGGTGSTTGNAGPGSDGIQSWTQFQ